MKITISIKECPSVKLFVECTKQNKVTVESCPELHVDMADHSCTDDCGPKIQNHAILEAEIDNIVCRRLCIVNPPTSEMFEPVLAGPHDGEVNTGHGSSTGHESSSGHGSSTVHESSTGHESSTDQSSSGSGPGPDTVSTIDIPDIPLSVHALTYA